MRSAAQILVELALHRIGLWLEMMGLRLQIAAERRATRREHHVAAGLTAHLQQIEDARE